MARRKTVLRCSCRNCQRGLHRKTRNRNGSRTNEVQSAYRSIRRNTRDLIAKAEHSIDDSSYDLVLDAQIESAGYTD
jgi:hypothetical protein